MAKLTEIKNKRLTNLSGIYCETGDKYRKMFKNCNISEQTLCCKTALHDILRNSKNIYTIPFFAIFFI